MTTTEAEHELDVAYALNPGPWKAHSLNVAEAARVITKKTGAYDPDKAYTYGLLHDIGRRFGFSYIRHTIDGYSYLLGRDARAAEICLSHSFPNKTLGEYQGEMDFSKNDKSTLLNYLSTAIYDYYDELIQIIDSLAADTGFVRMEVRWIDVAIRYGVNEYTIQKWKKVRELKERFNHDFKIDIDAILGISEPRAE